MRAPEAAIEFDEIEVRDQIECALGAELVERTERDEFEVSFGMSGPGAHNAELHVLAPSEGDAVLVTVFVRLQDLLALDRNWDGFTYPKPRKSPAPFETELGDHGAVYAEYRDVVVDAVITELGLKQGYSVADAIQDGETISLVCQEYEGAHANFGPSLDGYAPFLCGLVRSAFWELDEE